MRHKRLKQLERKEKEKEKELISEPKDLAGSSCVHCQQQERQSIVEDHLCVFEFIYIVFLIIVCKMWKQNKDNGNTDKV